MQAQQWFICIYIFKDSDIGFAQKEEINNIIRKNVELCALLCRNWFVDFENLFYYVLNEISQGFSLLREIVWWGRARLRKSTIEDSFEFQVQQILHGTSEEFTKKFQENSRKSPLISSKIPPSPKNQNKKSSSTKIFNEKDGKKMESSINEHFPFACKLFCFLLLHTTPSKNFPPNPKQK